MGLGQDIPEAVTEVPGAVKATADDIVTGVKSLSTDVQSLIGTLRNFRLRTEHDVNLKVQMPPTGSIVRVVLPPLILTTVTVVGAAFLVSWAFRRPRPHKPRLLKDR
jgi:hypothetical protein